MFLGLIFVNQKILEGIKKVVPKSADIYLIKQKIKGASKQHQGFAGSQVAEFQPFPPNKETRCRVLSFQPLARQSQSSTGQNRDQAFPMSLCSDCSSSHNKRRKTRIKGRRSHPALPNPRERLRKDGVALRQGLCLPCTFASLATNLGISFCKAKNGVTRLEKLPPSQTPRYRHLPFPYALRMRELTAPLLWLNAFSLM